MSPLTDHKSQATSSQKQSDASLSEKDKAVDAMSEASMDASDPPSIGGVTGVGAPSEDSATADASDPMDELNEAIRRRAYQLWEEAGRPAGESTKYWLAAERERRLVR